MTVDTDHPKGYTQEHRYGERGFPRGPLGHVESPQPTAIGFCPHCGANARRTTAVRGTFNCPACFHQWHDSRVGTHPKSIEDYISNA